MGNLKVAGLDIGNNTLSMNNDGKILVNGTVLQTEVDGVLPTGGTTGQILAKIDSADYNTTWIDAPTGGGSAEYPDQTGNAGKFLSTDGTNVLWSTINTELTNNSLRYITTGISMTSGFPATGAFVNYLTNISPSSDIDPAQIINTSTLKLLKGKTYKIDGGVESVQATSGTFNTVFRTYADANGTTLINVINDTYSYITHLATRNYRAGGYIKPTEDCYLKLFVDANTLASGTHVDIQYTITEISTLGLPEMPEYKLGEEVLTSERWLNGKPIYRMTIDCGALPNNTTKFVDIPNISAIDRNSLHITKSFGVRSSDLISYPLPFVSTISTAMVQVNVSSAGQILIRTTSDYSATSYSIVTVEYTKIADTASSPVAIIGGEGSREITLNGLSELPAYDTNEVLTSERWIDGRPIYRKTIDFGILPNAAVKSVAHGISNIGTKWINHNKSRVGNAYPIDFPNGSTTQMWVSWIDNTYVHIQTWTNRTNFSAFITIEYTKTTDTASSPVALIGGIASISKKLPVFSADTNILTASGTLSFVNTYVDTVSMQSGNTIVIPENGIYELGISGNIDTIGQFGIVLNGTQLLYGYENDDRAQIGIFTARQLVAGDVITFTYTEIQTAGAMLAGTAAFVTVKKISDSDGYITIANTSYDISSTEYVLPFTRNGKIVYGMEVDFGALPNATTKTVPIPNYNSAYKYITSSDSYAYDPVNKSMRPLPTAHSTNLIDLSVTNGLIYITCSGNRSAFTESKVVLHYTKD